MKPRLRGSNSVAPAHLPTRDVFGFRDSMRGYDDLDPELRQLLDRAPLPLNAADLLAHQRSFGVAETRRELEKFLQSCFPNWVPIEDHPNYARATRRKKTR